MYSNVLFVTRAKIDRTRAKIDLDPHRSVAILVQATLVRNWFL